MRRANGWRFMGTVGCVTLLASTLACDRKSNSVVVADVVAKPGGSTGGPAGASPGISSESLQLQELTNSCGAAQTQDFFKVINSGTGSIAASDITIKMWVDDTSGQTVVPHVWTGGCLTNGAGCFHQVSGVTASAAPVNPACGPDPQHQANWEITISNTDSTPIAPNVSWTNLQAGLNLANFSNFAPGTGSWYSPCLTGSTYKEDSHYAVYVKGNLVLSSSGLTPPICRSPQGQQPLTGYLTPAITGSPLSGPLPASTPITLAVGLPVSDPDGLRAKALAVSDPNNAAYRQYLKPADFITMFSPTTTAYQSIVSWATSNGLTVSGTYPNRLLVDVTGTAAQIERALFANLQLRKRPDGTLFYALDREPSIGVATPILRISGLDNRVLATSGAGTSPPGAGTGAGSGPGGLLVSSDFRKAYASCSTQTGQGQSVGLFELDGFLSSDITAYECQSGLATCDATGKIIAGTVPPVQTVTVDGYGGGITNTGGQSEVTIDIQMAIAMAPGLSQVVVYEAQNDGNIARINDVLNKMAGSGINQLSSSWFTTVDQNTQPILYSMITQGQSFFECAGDEGSSSWTTDPSDIRDLDGVTVVGGTALTLGGVPLAYQSETTWNLVGQGAGGGGIAANTSSPLNQASFSQALGILGKRTLPDVSLVATGEFGFLNGSQNQSFGTSLAAPLWAGFVALANQQAQSSGIGTVGYVNTFLYDVASAVPAIYNGSFNDIADGSLNAGSCPSGVASSVCAGAKWAVATTGSYAASSGYDLATGLGTPKCYLLNELATSQISAPPPPASGSGGAAGAGGAGGAAGSGGVDAGPVPTSIAVVATEGGRGVEFCMQGAGFTPGHLIQFTYLNLPANHPAMTEGQAPEIVGASGMFTNFDPTFGGGDSSEQGFIQNCSADDLTRSMTVQVAEVNDPTKFATATISNAWICGAKPAQTSTNETPLPNPPQFGDTTCPLPP